MFTQFSIVIFDLLENVHLSLFDAITWNAKENYHPVCID